MDALRRELADLKADFLARVAGIEARMAVLTEDQRYDMLRAKRAAARADQALSEEESLELEILEEKRELDRLQRQKQELTLKLAAPTPAAAVLAVPRDLRRSEVVRAFDSTIQDLLAASSEDAAGAQTDQEAQLQAKPKGRVSEADDKLRELALLSSKGRDKADSSTTATAPTAAAVPTAAQQEVEVEAGSQRLTEVGPDAQLERDRIARQGRRNSGGLRLSSSPSFSGSSQAELARSPQLKRAVQRAPPRAAVQAAVGHDEGDDSNSGDDSNEHESTESDDGPSAKITLRTSLHEVDDDDDGDGDDQHGDVGREYATQAQRYQAWVAEALDDLKMRGFGSTVDEVEAFRPILDDSDLDIARPNERFAEQLRQLWPRVGRAPAAAPPLQDVERLAHSVADAIARRRADFELLVQELKAQDERARAKRAHPQPVSPPVPAAVIQPKQGVLADLDFDISKALAAALDMNLEHIIPAKASSAPGPAVSVPSEPAQPAVDAAFGKGPALNPKAEPALAAGAMVEAKYDEDGLWYRARIEEPTTFGYWLTFVDYGNAQDTAPENVRPLSSVHGGGSGVEAFVVAGKASAPRNPSAARKEGQTASGKGEGRVGPAASQQPEPDVRAPVGGIAARMAQLREAEARTQAQDKATSPRKPTAKESDSVSPRKPSAVDATSNASPRRAQPAAKVAEPRADAATVPSKAAAQEAPRAATSPRVLDGAAVAKAADAATVPSKAAAQEAPRAATSPRVLDVESSALSPQLKSAPTDAAAPPMSPPATRFADDASSERKVTELRALRERLRLQRDSGALPGTSPEPAAASRAAEQALPVAADGVEALGAPRSSEEALALAERACAMQAPEQLRLVDVAARDKKRYDAVCALIDSEREYYSGLKLIMELFVLPLKLSGNAEILSGDEQRELFCNLELLYGLHKLLLGELTRTANGWSPESGLGSLMLLFAGTMKAYNLYTSHVGLAMVALTKFKTKHARAQAFKQLVEQAEASALCKDTNLRRLLNLPVRRPAQYSPLLRAVQRVTPAASPEHALLERACAAFEGK